MPFVVERTAQAKAAVDDTMTRSERGAYAAAVASVKGEGCRAGGYRLRSVDGDDYPLCCKHLRADWRMFTAYLDDDRIVIVAIDRHTPRNNPAATLATVLPGLATVGRRRDDKPPCCDDLRDPPAMSTELRALLDALL
ncbi:MAG: hypothetical protein ABI317_10795 [Gaiellales bacterium]